MNERRYELLAEAETHFLRVWADVIADTSDIQLIKGPTTGLCSMQVRDSASPKPFIVGDVFTTEIWASVDGVRGFGFCLGDDTEKALAAAVIDDRWGL